MNKEKRKEKYRIFPSHFNTVSCPARAAASQVLGSVFQSLRIISTCPCLVAEHKNNFVIKGSMHLAYCKMMSTISIGKIYIYIYPTSTCGRFPRRLSCRKQPWWCRPSSSILCWNHSCPRNTTLLGMKDVHGCAFIPVKMEGGGSELGE